MSASKYRKEHDCLNCGAHVEKHYCSSCGQPNLELKESFWGFISHSIAHYFHFDNKFFQTLNPLLTKPGQVTLDYLAGKRARYINPVSMYIFVSIVYFIVVPKASVEGDKSKHHQTKLERKQIERATSKLIDTSRNGENNVVSGIAKTAINRINSNISISEFQDRTFKEQEKAIAYLKSKSKTSDFNANLLIEYNKFHIIKQDSTYTSYLNRQAKLSASEKDNWFQRTLKKRDITVNQKMVSGWTLKEEIEHYRPKQYFLLMPILAMFIMIIFRKNKKYYLDHLIFTIHGMTAYFIEEIITSPIKKHVFGLDSTTSDFIGVIVFVAIVWYMYKALKLFYNRSRRATIWKMFQVVILYAITLVITEKIISETIYYFIA